MFSTRNKRKLHPHMSDSAVLSILLWVEESAEGNANQHYQLHRAMSPRTDADMICTASKIIRDMEVPAKRLWMRMRKDTYEVQIPSMRFQCFSTF